MFEGPEKKFQRHIADYFIREYKKYKNKKEGLDQAR